MKTLAIALVLSACIVLPAAGQPASMAFIEAEVAKRSGHSGVLVLETGAEALVARAWLADHATRSIDVQYFIWSTDNIGILAAEALLRAAERGVRVRVIVDDLLVDAPDSSLLALARHPNIDIRIYNPKLSVGVPLHERVVNVVTDFRGVNQRMHDKTLIVDGLVAVTGGRNMAAEYYDYNREYNFRDRDALVLGEAVKAMQASFERFWTSELSVKVETLHRDLELDDSGRKRIYRELQEYAASPENFAPEVRAAIATAPLAFTGLASRMTWGEVEFLSDVPGKNDAPGVLGGVIGGMSGGGQTASALARLVEGARERVVIQSPYVVLSERALELFRSLRARGVTVRISTNSLASTDNLQAFSGYRNQRRRLLRMGLEIYEYKPDPEVMRELVQRHVPAHGKPPVFALHAKTLVVDGRSVYIGTFNFDPRSENLNTEVGIVVHDEALARAVESSIETDMRPGNSWSAARDDPDERAPLGKRARVRLWQFAPIKPLL